MSSDDEEVYSIISKYFFYQIITFLNILSLKIKEFFKKEYNLLKTIDQQYIIKVKDFLEEQEGTKLILIMEFFDAKTLNHYISK